jgi:hypothetical protein
MTESSAAGAERLNTHPVNTIHETMVRSLRLLDLIAQSVPWQPDATFARPFRDPHEYAKEVRACPLRLVLADDFTRCSTAMAYSEGDRLSGCLDLVRIPHQQVWVEWAETPRLDALSALLEKKIEAAMPGGRAGVLISADASGRTGSIRSFWSTIGDRPHCASLIADFDLDSHIRRWTSVVEVFKGAPAALTVLEEPAFDSLLGHMRFRFDPDWLKHYRAEDLSGAEQAAVLCAALGSIAFIVPMLFAAFLLITGKGGARQRPMSRDRFGKRLPHVEVSAAIGQHGRAAGWFKESRGHLTRRGHKVVWSSSPSRGDHDQGGLGSRTVKLSFR